MEGAGLRCSLWGVDNMQEEKAYMVKMASMIRGVEESPGKWTESFLSWCLHSSNIFSCRVTTSSPTYSLYFLESPPLRA